MSQFCLVAGEASGDLLGASLIRALGEEIAAAGFAGVAGPRMVQAGCQAWWPASSLSHFGLFEVLGEIPRLIAMRRQLRERILDCRPSAFIGIDAPDFNLGLERQLRANGVPVCHYVSPSVWAWRQRRVKKIAASVDLMLCLFPFEPEFYRRHGVTAQFVGHPMADEIADATDADSARAALGIEVPAGQRLIALLPGSRSGEVRRHGELLAAAAQQLRQDLPGIRFVAGLADQAGAAQLQTVLPPELSCSMHVGRSREVMAAADVLLVASGTATLEGMLIKRPMVVVYRIHPATYQLARMTGIVKTRRFSLPNILADDDLVPELIQDQATPEAVAAAARRWLEHPGEVDVLTGRFAELHERLRGGGSVAAAQAILDLAQRRRP